MKTMSEDVVQGLMAQIATIAPAKEHRLSRDMVDGSRKLTEASARQVLAHLRKCADKPGEPAARRDQEPGEPLPPIGAFRDIPKGYYATPSATGANDLDFWRVSKGRKGSRWEGISFAARVLGGGDGDSMRTVDLSNIQQRLALQAIERAGADAAGMAFAAAIKRCRDCGLVLTDQVSRDAGRGPDCRTKSSRSGG